MKVLDNSIFLIDYSIIDNTKREFSFEAPYVNYFLTFSDYIPKTAL